MQANSLQLKYDKSHFFNCGISKEAVNKYDIIIFPENIIGETDATNLVDTSDAVTLFKLLKEQGVKCANSIDLGLTVPMIERRSIDTRLGVIYIRDKLVIPVLATVLGGLILHNIVDGKSEKVNDLDGNKVHLDLYIEDSTKITSIKYDGDGEILINIIEALK